jgi:hypothetical protein
MPNTQDWNLAPGTDVGPLAMSETGDGTLHAGVYDTWDNVNVDPTLGTRWGSPRGTVRWAVFYSTDGGYDWKMGWELPEDDPGPIIDIVQAPGYEHPGWVYMITALHLYYSSDGGESFVRTTKCPGVQSTTTTPDLGYLTSLDVTKVPDACPACDEYMAVVGVSCGQLDSVYTYNDEGVGVWYDKEITNYPAGTGPQGSVPVYEVRFSPNYDEDGGIAAVAFYDPSNIGSAFNTVYGPYTAGATTLVTWFDGVTKTWANQYLDAPFLTGLGGSIGQCDYAVLDFADDFTIGSQSLFVGIAGTDFDDVYGVKLTPPASGPSSVSRLNISGGADQPIDSLVVYGAGGFLNASMLVGIRDVTQPPIGPGVANGFPAQIVRGTNLAVTPSVQWLRSIKPPEGRYLCDGEDPNNETRDCNPLGREYTGLVFVVARDVEAGECGLGCTGDAHASTGYTGVPSGVPYGIVPGPDTDDKYVFSGVWHCAPSMAGMTWNGTGLLDDILASSTYLNNNYINYAEVVWEEVSPDYANDATQYFVSWSDWSFYWAGTGMDCYCNGTLFWWRTMDNGETWDMLYRENTRMAVGFMTGMPDVTAAEYLNLLNNGVGSLRGWSVRTTPQFTLESGPVPASVGGTGTLYILGNNWPAKGLTLGNAWWLWYSPDGGNAILPKSGMPQLDPTTHTYMHLGWDVFDSNTVALGDDQGLVYITTDGSNSWTDGVATHYQQNAYVTNLKFSPTYSNDPGEGEDQTILVGVYYADPGLTTGVAEVWISQDGAKSDFTMLGTFPGEQLPCTLADMTGSFTSQCLRIVGQLVDVPLVMPVVVDFDNDWNGDDVTTVYAAASGLLDEMENYGGTLCCEWKLLCHGDVGLYRADVVLGSPTVSIWEPMYDWDQLEALLPYDPALESRSSVMPWFVRVILFTALEVGNHNTVYTPYSVFDSWDPLATGMIPGRITHGGVLRSPDGRAAEVEIDNVTLGLPRWTGLFLLDAVPGSTYLFTIGDRLDLTPGLRDMRLMGYHDTLCAAAEELEAGASPADDERAGIVAGELEKVNVPVSWGAASSDAPVTYEWQLSQDPNFTSLVDSGQTTGTKAQFEQLEKDTQYYWRVRVVKPAHSAWTAAQGFKTVKSELSSQVTAPSMENASPELGATDVSLQPTLGWGAMGGADYYNLQVATDSDFSDVVIEEETEGTAYTPDSDLEKNTTYYWRVQGCTDDGECSDWSSTGHFTTGPPEEEPSAGTPAWVWVVIVIGAILAIAVIVLIVRTRRPA